MSSAVLVRLRTARNAGFLEAFHGTFRQAVGGGWQTGKDGNRFKQYITSSTTKAENALEADFAAPSFLSDFSGGTHALVCQTWDGTDSIMYINGRNMSVRSPGGGGFTPETVTYKWGVNAFGVNDPFEGAVCAAALDESNVWTEDQMFDYWLAVKDASALIDGGLSWEHLWSLQGETALPATLEDVGSGTARDLTLVGALDYATHVPQWFQY